MANIRKYPQTSGYWVYAHVLPTKEVYIGMSKQQPSERWCKSKYKTSAIAPYITEYGWENIEHRILIDGLTKKEAEQVEDWFICKATADGFCINKYRSGGIERNDKQEYMKQRYKDRKEEIKSYREDHKEEIKQYHKQRLSTPEGKIYNRVSKYNQRHTPIETPMEAKQKYLETGYIPNYIKNDDLC